MYVAKKKTQPLSHLSLSPPLSVALSLSLSRARLLPLLSHRALPCAAIPSRSIRIGSSSSRLPLPSPIQQQRRSRRAAPPLPSPPSALPSLPATGGGRRLETDGVPRSELEAVEAAVDAAGGRVTVGDVAAAAGLPLSKAEAALAAWGGALRSEGHQSQGRDGGRHHDHHHEDRPPPPQQPHHSSSAIALEPPPCGFPLLSAAAEKSSSGGGGGSGGLVPELKARTALLFPRAPPPPPVTASGGGGGGGGGRGSSNAALTSSVGGASAVSCSVESSNAHKSSLDAMEALLSERTAAAFWG